MYSGGLLSSPIWWSQIADSHCLSWKAAACMHSACGPVYYAALSLTHTKTVHWSTNTDPAGATWQQIPGSSNRSPPESVQRTEVHSSYAYSECQRPEFRCYFKCVFSISVSLPGCCIQSRERSMCVLRKRPAIQKKSLRCSGSEITQKEPSQQFTSDTAGRNPTDSEKKVTCIYLHEVPYIFFVSVSCEIYHHGHMWEQISVLIYVNVRP